jgi:virginiamycin A acetyltransferase
MKKNNWLLITEKNIKLLIVQIKMAIKIHFVYVKKYPQHKIKSILPNESLLDKSKGIYIEEDVRISTGLEHIGNRTFIGHQTEIILCKKIGSFTSISSNVKIGLMAHPKNWISTSPIFYAKRHGWVTEDKFNETEGTSVEIGNDVLISANALIKNGVTIADGAIIGAGAFVNKDVPPYAIVVGCPAEIIGYRFEKDTIEKLLKLNWWDKDENTLKQNLQFANNPLTFIDNFKQ